MEGKRSKSILKMTIDHIEPAGDCSATCTARRTPETDRCTEVDDTKAKQPDTKVQLRGVHTSYYFHKTRWAAEIAREVCKLIPGMPLVAPHGMCIMDEGCCSLFAEFVS